MRTLLAAATAAIVIGTALPAAAQPGPARDRALIQNRLGWENMRVEQFEDAVKNFSEATTIDPSFEEGFYGLGRAHMALKRFEQAIAAYTRSRDLYRARAGRQFANAQDAQRARRDRVLEIDERIRYMQSLPPTMAIQDQIRQLQDYRRQQMDTISRGNNITIDSSVPVWVSLALGSAYFRAGRMIDAEREYKAAIDADPRTGEAHQNLAVVYLTTQRFEEAERALQAAKKTGFKVNPALEQEIKEKRKGTAG